MTAVAVGTLVGLGVKYYLDKRWIFFDHKKGVHHYSRQFSLYALMGIFTTTIFWGFETVFLADLAEPFHARNWRNHWFSHWLCSQVSLG